nr:S-layer homology domain-containing protein [uncultured Agathobaculum sp.]
MKKRILSALLTLCMMLTMIPAAFAAGQERITDMPVTTSATDVSDVTTYSTTEVAEYNDTRYTSLEAAVSAANENGGGEIKLLGDVTLKEKLGITTNITIDGGGNTISGDVNSPDVYIYVTGSDVNTVTISNVTVKDFGGNAPTTSQWGLFKVYSTSNDTVFKAVNVTASNFNRAAFDIRSGNFEITDCYIDCQNQSTSKLTKGVLAENAHGTISGTTIINAESEGVGDWNTNAIETWGNTGLTVTGCTLGTPGAEVKNGISMNAGTGESYVIARDTTIVAVADGGRTFKLTPDATGTGTASVDIQSGNYSGTFKINQGSVSGKGCEIEVNGGTFNTSAADYLADNLKYEVNNNGSYTYYESIDDARDAAGSTGSINPVPDVTYHTVTLIYEIGTDTVSVAADDDFTLPNIDRPGYELTGWSNDVNSNIYQIGNDVKILSDVTFTAQWTPVVQHAVTYDYGYDGINNTVYITSGDTVTLPDAPMRDGFTFGGWNDGTTTYDAGATVTITADVNFTAQWTPNQTGGGGGSGGGGGGGVATHTITVDPVDNGSITVSPLRASSGDTVTITVTPDAGYELDALTVTDANGNEITLTDAGNGSYTFEMPNSAVTINATFTEAADEPSDLPFRDVADNAWYYDAVEYVYRNGMMVGTSLTRFSPDMTTTRGMIVTILYRLEGEPDAPATSFIDVEPNMYYADAIGWAEENGVVNGVSPTEFAPNQPITREQMAAILFRYAQHKNYDVTIGGMSLNEYADAHQISGYAVSAMQWANENGLIIGRSGNMLAPQDTATRAEVATILMRFCENIA